MTPRAVTSATTHIDTFAVFLDHYAAPFVGSLLWVLGLVIAISIFAFRDTASLDYPLLIIWVVLTAWGVVTTLWTVRDCYLERIAVEGPGPHDIVLQAIAAANLRREFVRLFVLGALLAVGASVLLGWNDPTTSRLLIISAILALVSNSILDRLERRTTSRLLRARQADEDAEAAAALPFIPIGTPASEGVPL